MKIPPRHRWFVQRAMTASTGYAHGWFAQSYDGLTGAVFPTWAEAQAFADKMSRTRTGVAA